MYLLHLSNASGGGSLEFGLFAVVSKKMPVMFAGEGIVGAAGVGVGRVASELNHFQIEMDDYNAMVMGGQRHEERSQVLCHPFMSIINLCRQFRKE